MKYIEEKENDPEIEAILAREESREICENINNLLEKLSVTAPKLYLENNKSMQKLINSILEQLEAITEIYIGLNIFMPIENQDNDFYKNLIKSTQKACDSIAISARKAFNLANLFTSSDEIMAFDEGSKKQKKLFKADFTLSEEPYICIKTDHVPPNTRLIGKSVSSYKFQIREQFEKQINYQKSKLKNVMIIVLNHYDSNAYATKDNDNYYNKVLMDLAAREFVGGDDEPQNVQYVSYAVADIKAFTEIIIIPKREYPRWIYENKGILGISKNKK